MHVEVSPRVKRARGFLYGLVHILFKKSLLGRKKSPIHLFLTDGHAIPEMKKGVRAPDQRVVNQK